MKTILQGMASALLFSVALPVCLILFAGYVIYILACDCLALLLTYDNKTTK